jgi:hypothetical protein
MGDLTRGETFAAGESVTHTRLHALVESAELVAGCVGTTELADGAVTNAKLDAALSLSAGKIALASGKLLGGNGSGAGEAVTVGATLSLSAATLGVATGGIAAAQLATDAVETAKIKDANVTLAKIANVTDARLLGRSAGSAGAPQEITVGSGLSLSGGALTATATGSPQVVQTHTASATSYSMPTARASAVEIAAITTAITPVGSGSKVLVTINLSHEVASTNNAMFILTRTIGGTETEIGSGTSSGNRLYGIAAAPYDSDVVSTMAHLSISYLDSPATTSACTYKLKAYADSAVNLFVNRTVTDSDSTTYERASSRMILQEFLV